ncbi:COR domain-containing protein [Merismopedia glauca]|uniref:non-specific serine/threonine protein kinase n=1 Tax=Merismopedia glauca CCAP 1448/3 TaxID=1296344 RepID=A0A2T1C2Q3_9CYAN|nr:COR domain-containing protein [Merismopedia glauca]PSB02484.1 GTPase [Merismopedia glauca CCAP 1448/3]
MKREELLRLIERAAAEGWKELDLAGLGLEELPEEIGKCTQLETLVLGKWDEEKYQWVGNQLTEFPDVILQLTNLKTLNLNFNQIRAIPKAIAELSKLTSLNLWSNQIRAIPEAIAKLSKLTWLDLSINQITEIPEAIAELSKLTWLNLSSNQITEIPEAIAELSNLTWLNLWSNQITEIPEAIAELSNLTELDLSFNQITEIPAYIAQLSKLTELDLSGNQITEIPEAMRRLEKLEKLDLRGNLLPIPPEILGKKEFWQDPGDVHTILDFYFQTRDPNATEELNEAKLLIVGEGEAGKTTLAHKLLNPDYELKEQEPTTEGIDVLRWEVLQANGKPFRVHLWDFGGQEIYHTTHQFFLTERSLYILLVDNRRQNPNLCYWLSIIELLSDKSPVLLVQNEKQDIRCEINISQLRGDFDNLETSVATNLATNRGLENLKRHLQQRITTLKHVGEPIPKHWANVRYVLENYAQRQTRIEANEFYQICANHGFDKSDKRAMLSLSHYLHHLGIILHFQKDPVLKHLVILRPEWATNAVYKVTSNKQVIANFGYFTDKNLSEIWHDQEYNDLHDELLQLLKNFKLCYEIPNQPKHYIAPQLLALEPPSYTWDDTDNLIIRYEYDFMPKGIITRLMVEMHGLIKDNLVWRDGVILGDNYTQAEVIENYHQREISIRISGTQKKPLLERIRYEIWKIHQSYDNRLKYQEFIPCNCVKCKESKLPHTYPFQILQQFYSDRQYQIQCQKSYQMVNVRGLMDDFPDPSQQWEREQASGKEHLSSQNIFINPPRDTMTQESPKNQFIFNNPVSAGAIGSDNEVHDNQFIQTNNANTAELLKSIASLRQTAQQFPEDVRDEIIIDIEDVEAEIQKPEAERNHTRLKKSLKAIIATAIAIAIPIAGITDFTNTALDLGSKLGIELHLPPAP